MRRNKHGADFVVADTLEDPINGMNKLTDQPLLDPAAVRAQIEGATAAPRSAGRRKPETRPNSCPRPSPHAMRSGCTCCTRSLDPCHGPNIWTCSGRASPINSVVRALREGSSQLRRIAFAPVPDGVLWLAFTATLDMIVPGLRSVPAHTRVETVTAGGVGHLGMLVSRQVVGHVVAALPAHG
jgi:hypothetical protein